MKLIILLGALLLTLNVFAQERMLCFDLISGKVDTLEAVSFDTTITSARTNYYEGGFDSSYAPLEQTPPVSNTFPGSQFTRKRVASQHYDLDQYPVRTSIKIFVMRNDTLRNNCSGSLISNKHVLTAAHCLAELNKDSLKNDSFFVCPVYDYGNNNPRFSCSWVKKIYIPLNWNSAKDMAVLELTEPIGSSTGWLSIGYEEDDSLLKQGIFYKFSYPAVTILQLDTNSYNGDTLYFNYGVIDLIEPNFIGVKTAWGIPGESGSSLIKVENNRVYTSYGVFCWTVGLRHQRITNWTYYAIESIIKNHLEPVPSDPLNFLSLYPNPATKILSINNPHNIEIKSLAIYDSRGRKVALLSKDKLHDEIDISALPAGWYIFLVESADNVFVKKVIKYDY